MMLTSKPKESKKLIRRSTPPHVWQNVKTGKLAIVLGTTGNMVYFTYNGVEHLVVTENEWVTDFVVN